jgi:hypothetical protein
MTLTLLVLMLVLLHFLQQLGLGHVSTLQDMDLVGGIIKDPWTTLAALHSKQQAAANNLYQLDGAHATGAATETVAGAAVLGAV